MVNSFKTLQNSFKILPMPDAKPLSCEYRYCEEILAQERHRETQRQHLKSLIEYYKPKKPKVGARNV